MLRIVLTLLLAGVFIPSLQANRGDLISAETIRDWDPAEASENYWNIIAGMVPQSERESFRVEFSSIMDELMVGKRIVSYRVVYQTIDHYGNPTQASGLVLLPVHDSKTCELPIYYYGHGTAFERYSIPSRPERWGVESFFAYFPAALNFISVAPDYYGMGDGPGFHHHNSAQTNSTSGIDLIRAARQLAVQQNIAYNSQVFISGYSEGGHNAMGILKKVYDENLRSEFNIVSAGCGSGAYDLSDLSYHYILDNPYYPTRAYILYLLGTCEDIYGNLINEDQGESVSTYLKYPYDSLYTVHLLGQDGNMGWVPLPWTDLFNPGVMESVVANPNHPLRQCLKQSNLYDWPNPFRTSLYFVKTDEQVYWKNSPKAKLAQWKYIPWYRFWDKARIATHDMTDGGRVPDHFQGAVPIMLHYLIYTNISKIMKCSDSTGRYASSPEGFEVNYDKTVEIPASAFPNLKAAAVVSFSDFTTSPAALTYDASEAVYRVRFPDIRTGAYMLRLTDAQGQVTHRGLVSTEPNFLEDAAYSPISVDQSGNYLLDMTLLEDKVSRINIYTEAGAWQKRIDDPYAVLQLAGAGELAAGDYVVEVVGQAMRYYLRMPVQGGTEKAIAGVYPNPFGNELVVQTAGIGTVISLSLFSADGRSIEVPFQTGPEQLRIRTASLPAGIYMLQVNGELGTRTEKVIKYD